jgi:membrane associated rhomboid family serine protease
MFFPIRDDNPTVRTPYVTVGLIILNTAIFLFGFTQGDVFATLMTVKYGYIPAELVHTFEMTPEFAFSAWLTPFTSMFLHSGWMHLIGNMLFLWIYGNNIEDYFGHVKFILFYLLSGLAAVALFTALGPSSEVPLVGASGAIAGVMGGYIVLHPRAKITILFLFIFIQLFELPAKVVLGFWFVYQLVMSLLDRASGGGIAWAAHVGGFVFGWLVLTLLIKIMGRGGQTDSQRTYRMTWG